MVEGIPIEGLVQFASNFGVAAVILVIWYVDQRAMQKVLAQYRSDMAEQRKMYENNVELVKRYCALAEGLKDYNAELKDVVLLHTRAMTKLIDSIETNQYCPQVRLQKQAVGVQG